LASGAAVASTSSGSPLSAFASGATGGPTVSLTATKAGSLVYGVGNDWNGAVPRVLGANQVMVHEALGASGDTFWMQRLTNPTTAAGIPVLVNDVGPIDHEWNMAAVEITPAATASTKLLPSITWPTPADIVKGTALGAAQLNATSTVPGTFVYTPPAGTMLNAGSGQALSVTLYPTDGATYQTATASVLINVLTSAPTVTWGAPAPITTGTALSALQLNATADVPGTFVYSPALGIILPVGQQTLTVTFTPTNTAFAPIVKKVPLPVVKRVPVISTSKGPVRSR